MGKRKKNQNTRNANKQNGHSGGHHQKEHQLLLLGEQSPEPVPGSKVPDGLIAYQTFPEKSLPLGRPPTRCQPSPMAPPVFQGSSERNSEGGSGLRPRGPAGSPAHDGRRLLGLSRARAPLLPRREKLGQPRRETRDAPAAFGGGGKRSGPGPHLSPSAHSPGRVPAAMAATEAGAWHPKWRQRNQTTDTAGGGILRPALASLSPSGRGGYSLRLLSGRPPG